MSNAIATSMVAVTCRARTSVRVRRYESKDRAPWDDYVDRHEDSTFYHRIGWKNVIEKSFGHRTYQWLAEDQDGNIKGILPLAHLRSLLFGSFMVSLPYFNYGGACAQDDESHGALLEAAIDFAKEKSIDHIELRYDRPIQSRLAVKQSKVSMRLRLGADSAALWKSFGSKLRSQIARPQKEGMYARIGGEEELDSFYRVFSINMKDLGTPVYSRSFFQNILDEFPASTRICSVYDKARRPVASGFLIGFRDTLEIPWASSLREYKSSSPNMLLYWKCLEFACDNGYRTFDFGRSTSGSGTYRFKEQWGATPQPLYWHYWVRTGGRLPELNPGNPKYQLGVKLWRKLPLRIATTFGPLIVKNLP